MKMHSYIETCRMAIRNRKSLLAVGQPGIGKTDGIAQACELEGVKLFLFFASSSEPSVVMGFPKLNEDYAGFVPYGVLAELIKATDNGEPVVLSFDDCGQATPAMQSAMMQIVGNRILCDRKLADNVVIMGTTNRKGDKANVMGLIEPLKSKFGCIINIELDVDSWLNWAKARQNRLSLKVINFIEQFPGELNHYQPSLDIVNGCTPRNVAKAAEWMKDFDHETVSRSDIHEIIEGCVGREWMVKFNSWLDLFDKLPMLGEIRNNPLTAPVPENISAQYAISCRISDDMTPVNFSSYLNYVNRMRKDIMGATVINATMRDKTLMSSVEFIQFAIANQSLFANLK